MDLRDKRVDLILQQLEELPTLPAVAARVLAVTADDDSSAGDVVTLIESDPSLSARILQLTRRADRGVRDADATTVSRAVVLLGFDAVRNAVLAVSVFQALGPADGGPGGGGGGPAGNRKVGREEFWKHCLAVACGAELLAEEMNGGHGHAGHVHGAPGHGGGGVSPSDAFLCGLLHDLGKIALDVALPKSYARVVEAAELLRGDIADLERTVIGVDHQVAGKRVAERWQLPPAVRDAAWLHNTAPDALPRSAGGGSAGGGSGGGVNATAVNLVTLADWVARRQHLGYSGNHAFPVARDALLAALGLSAAAVDRAAAALVGRMGPRLAALGLDEQSGDELYQQAIARADLELRRVSGQLHQTAAARRPATPPAGPPTSAPSSPPAPPTPPTGPSMTAGRPSFFDALQRFQSGLRADATSQQVLAAVARSAAGVVGAGRAVAFGLAPSQDYAEAVAADVAGSPPESALVELPGLAGLTNGPQPLTPGELLALRGTVVGSDKTGGGSLAAAPAAAPPLVPPHGLPPDANPVLPAGDPVDRLIGPLVATLTGPANPTTLAGTSAARFWLCLQSEGACVGGVVWAAAAGEPARLSGHARELSALAHAWALALRMAQVREESRALAEELAEANRRLTVTRDALLRTRALTTVGEMAAGAAHEMNNPLAVISGRSQLLARTLTDERQRAMATLVHEQADRLSGIITEMMAFAKPQPPKPVRCEVGHLIAAAMARSKARTLVADRSFEVAVAGDLPALTADPDQLADALAEVIDNAVQATHPKSGRVAVTAAHDPWGGRAVVTVADNGCGMDPAALDRAFDPFFSSKPAGRRRGLGLSKALRWVEAAGGSVRLDSRPGDGTRVVVLLPVGRSGRGDERK